MAAEALEQSVLESKDKDQLLAIAKALGLKASSRTKKSDIIDSILDSTGAGASSVPSSSDTNGDGGHEPAGVPSLDGADKLADSTDPFASPPEPASNGDVQVESDPASSTAVVGPLLDADGEPLAEWELELASIGDLASTSEVVDGATTSSPGTDASRAAGQEQRRDSASSRQIGQPSNPRPASSQQGGQRTVGQPGQDQSSNDQSGGDQHVGDIDGESRNRRRRRRRKGGPRADGPQGDDTAFVEVEVESQPVPAISNEPVPVDGYLDMRDEGYGFLRVKGYLPSRDDAYIPVKLARQYGLRKGDHITGTSRPAGRNEKNPALLEVLTVNGGDPEVARRRPRFEDLTALFPDSNLRLENPNDPTNMTARIIDLVSPIGKGQRGIIVSPPKAGKTTIMKTIAKSIEDNNPEVKLIVLLIDERPEEVTDMRRHVQRGEVIASTFDRPSDEHTHVAELAIEKAKRLVEQGEDVVVILDGITRLSRAYNLAAPASGRILSGGIDAGALYPPKKFFGAARNIEEGGSLTILATALVETNSRMDEAIFEEFKGTGNMELRLDRRLAERRIYPAIDVDASSTRHEELLFDRKQLQMVWKLRRVLSGLAADGNAAPGLELLIDRLKTFRTNAEFLNEISKQPGM